MVELPGSQQQRSYVFDDVGRQAERDRLRTLEGVFDPATRGHLLATGLGVAWRCLEVGAGAGSVARWMSGVVGPTGHVLAVDVNTGFLSPTDVPGVEVREADIRTTELPPASFDVAHARFVLIHVPDWVGVLAAMTAALKPGGWLLIEEPDFSRSVAVAGPPGLRQAFDSVHGAIAAMFGRRGMDHAFGARLPAALRERGFEKISVDTDAPIVPGGSAFARMMGLSAEQLRDKYLATGLATETDLERYATFTSDPACRATYHATVSAYGAKPIRRQA